MNELELKLIETLSHNVERLHKAGLPQHLVAQMERLITQVEQPCVVAVVGRVKAGKSTFINSLLGTDLAKVGPTETTATINYFRYGVSNPSLPVRCYWSSGKVTNETRQFLDDLQGNDLETLQRANGIDHLEYHLPNPYLEQITLVDTPGTGAVVDEHQNRTAEYLNLSRQLRERHHQETQRIGSEADAVIYLIGETARVTDDVFLKEFQNATQGQSRALNALGVMAKIDLNPEVIQRREELSKKIAVQLQDSLNTVIPVSAGMQRALDTLLAHEQTGLKQLMTTIRRIPFTQLDELLSDPELYLEMDCPVSSTERKNLRGKMHWQVFATVAKIAANPSLEVTAIAENLRAIAGFVPLRNILEYHFIKRGSLLRNYRIVNDALQVVNTVKFSYLNEFHKRAFEDAQRRERFLAFIRGMRSDLPVVKELELFVQERLAPRVDLGLVVAEVEREIARIKYQLEDYNADFEALRQLEDHMNLFKAEELSELHPLFGLYGLATEDRLLLIHNSLIYVGQRQEYWEQQSFVGRSPIVRAVAQQAVRRYGLIGQTLV